MVILNIETSTAVCSVALTREGQVLTACGGEPSSESNHAQLLPVYVDTMIAYMQEHALRADAVAVSAGPGSYTGLRIGISMAKGLSYGWHIPLIPIDTLQLIALGARQRLVESGRQPQGMMVAMTDARRMEVYTAIYRADTLECVHEPKSLIIDAQAYVDIDAPALWFCGDGADKCRGVIVHPSGHFFESSSLPDARYMGWLADREATALGLHISPRMLEQKEMAYFEPFYLKDFVPAPSHVKGLQ